MKREANNMGGAFAKHVTGKGLVSRIYRELSKFSKKEINNPTL